MFDLLGRAVARHPRTTIGVWLTFVLACGLLALTGLGGDALFDRLRTGEPQVRGTESREGSELLAEAQDTGEQITLLVAGTDLTDPELISEIGAALEPAHTDLPAIDGVAEVVDPFLLPGVLEHPAAEGLVSQDQDGFLVSVVLEDGLAPEAEETTHDAVVQRLEQVGSDLAAVAPDAQVTTSSSTLIADDIVGQVQDDLVTGEMVALPVALVLMVIVFGGFLAAGLPLLGAVASIVGGLGALLAFTYLLDVDSYVVNVVTVLGLGLSIDYGLLIVSRYREELRRLVRAEEAAPAPQPGARRRRRSGRDRVVESALRTTVATAGRTVTFSAVTVAVAVSGLLLMRADMLRSLSASAVAIVLIAVLSAVTLVPALLVLLGRRLVRPSVLSRVPGLRRFVGGLGDVAPEQGFFSRLARFVHARPWPVLLGVLALLAVLASPVTGLAMRSSTVELLPPGSEQREFISVLAEDYPGADSADIVVVTDGTEEEAADHGAEIASLAHVERVEPPTVSGDYTVLRVHTTAADPGGAEATAAVADIRALDATVGTWVTGQAANQKDFNDSLVDGMPIVATVVILATFVLLFLMTGSVLVPLKALLTNVISLAASLGITVWIFQEGHGAELLGFEPVAGLESTVVPLILTFGFGLAMDYEVFLLTRIKEFWDAGATNDQAVERGMQRSGRIITSAALIIVAVFAGFVAGDLIVIKQVGVALALTVAIDATLVRMLLVPATMTLLGPWNWWAPAPLRRLHDRFAIVH